MVRRVPPDEAHRMMAEGWSYIDVRSAPEFAAGQPAGAYNVPLFHATAAGGRTANPDFARVMQARFSRDHKLLIGCRTGSRSPTACETLAALGFAEVCDVRGGMAGELDVLGQIRVEGWEARDLPISKTPEPGRSWAELEKV
jgi:rhodanese-related sulfurtransferase